MALIADAPARRAGMVHESAARPAVSNGSLLDVVRRFAALAAHRIGRWRDYRRTMNELEALDDRALRDMAISRGELKRIAREAAGY